MKKILLSIFAILACSTMYGQAFVNHIVQRGETLDLIAKKFSVSEQEIRDQNEDFDLDILYVGLPLQIPVPEKFDCEEEVLRFNAIQSSTNSIYTEANNYYIAGQYRKAIKLYTKAIKENPQTDLYYLRGKCYLAQGKYKSAINDLEVADGRADLSLAYKENCSSLLSDAKQRREAQLKARAEAWGTLFAAAAVTTASVLQAKAANDAARTTGGNRQTISGGTYSSNTIDSNSDSESSGNSSPATQRKKTCQKSSGGDLAHCNGTGVCANCNGKGKYFSNAYGNPHWVDPCVTCNGSGKCPSCGGTGYRN